MPTRRKQISTAIKGILEGVSGVGVVQEYHRYTRTPEGFKEFFTELVSQYERTASAWLISRDSLSQTTTGMPIPWEMREHQFVISGYVGLKDSTGTEETFQDLIDEIVDAFESRKELGLAGIVEYVRPLQVPVIDHAWLGPILCHHCEIQLAVLERHIITYVS